MQTIKILFAIIFLVGLSFCIFGACSFNATLTMIGVIVMIVTMPVLFIVNDKDSDGGGWRGPL